jgi:hypothetical protein
LALLVSMPVEFSKGRGLRNAGRATDQIRTGHQSQPAKALGLQRSRKQTLLFLPPGTRFRAIARNKTLLFFAPAFPVGAAFSQNLNI